MQLTTVTNRYLMCPLCGGFFGQTLQADEYGLYMQCYSCKRNFDVQLELEPRPEQTAEGLPF